jgi:hypothetical protein
VKRLVLLVALALAGVLGLANPAGAQSCGLPDAQPLWLEFADGSVQFRDAVFGHAGVIAATRGTAVAQSLRKRGAATTYWEMNLERYVGTPQTPADPAAVGAAADRLFDQAAASSACSTPWIALNELREPTASVPWAAKTAQYRSAVLAFVQRLAARGARPFLLVPSNPRGQLDAPGWWRDVAEVADIVREVYFAAPQIVAQGPLLGSRALRTKMRTAVQVLLAMGIAPERIGIMLGFQSIGIYGRAGLQPLSSWLEFVKLNALAARQVAGETELGTVWSWGWGTFSPPSADPDKPTAACVYLWTRDRSLCDAPSVVPSDFDGSLTEGQIALAPAAQCSMGAASISRAALADFTTVAGSRATAYAALFTRLVQRTAVPAIPAAEVAAAERRVIDGRFRHSLRAYLARLESAQVSRARAREVLADELRRALLKEQLGGAPITPWTVDQQTNALTTATCLEDDLPPVKDVRLATYLPFLARP